MKIRQGYLFTFLLCFWISCFLFCGLNCFAQIENDRPFIVSYAIVVKGKKIDGIAESYNGGTLTAFVQGNKIRLRLVSLMRTQSIYFSNNSRSSTRRATIVKESGKVKTKFYLSDKEWKIYNSRNDSNTCTNAADDSTLILNKKCLKTVIHTRLGDSLLVYYYPGFKNELLIAAQPLFSCIPGFVMKYTYFVGEKSIEYTATSLTGKAISSTVFTVPVKGYLLQKYRPGKSTINVNELNNENVDDAEDDEDELRN